MTAQSTILSERHLPENLTRKEFRSTYGGAGAKPYRKVVREIDRRLAQCPGLE